MLRHYNASIMLALNVPDKYAMERMGYSTPATLKKATSTRWMAKGLK